MKKMFSNRSICIVLLLSAGLIFNISCQEEEDTSPPDITNVRSTDPDLAGVTLTAAALGDWLVIQGTGFQTTHTILFNGLEASFNPTFVTATDIVVQVPDATPTLATTPEVPNTLTVITKYGEDTYTLTALPPPPIFERVSNEFAKEGEVITLSGRYFYFIESIVFPGDVPATTWESAPDGTWCNVTVPAGATQAGDILVTSQSGPATMVFNPGFHDTTGMFLDFENPAVQLNPEGVQFVDETFNPFIKSVNGKYMWSYVPTGIPTGSYWIVATALESDISLILLPEDLIGTLPGDIELRFELYVRRPWHSGFYEFGMGVVTWKYRYLFRPWKTPDGERVTYHPDGWRTISIPLSSFWNSIDGWEAEAIPPLTYDEFYGGMFNMNFKNGTDAEGELPYDKWEVAFDNMRLVKIR